MKEHLIWRSSSTQRWSVRHFCSIAHMAAWKYTKDDYSMYNSTSWYFQPSVSCCSPWTEVWTSTSLRLQLELPWSASTVPSESTYLEAGLIFFIRFHRNVRGLKNIFLEIFLTWVDFSLPNIWFSKSQSQTLSCLLRTSKHGSLCETNLRQWQIQLQRQCRR